MGDPQWSDTPTQPQWPAAPAQPAAAAGQGRVIAGVAAGVVALALLGFGVGWLAFHGGTPHAGPPQVVPPPSAVAPSVIASGGLPDYTGQDFVAVRADLRAHQMGVRLFFGTGVGQTVARTDPAPGARVGRGQTVKVYVTGPAPLLSLPTVVGQVCNDGGRALADAGVYPQYPTGRAGTVVSTEPDATATTVHWNDNVKVVCARPGSTPSPVPSASVDPSDPDASPPPDPSGSPSSS
jgi:PASTA domain